MKKLFFLTAAVAAVLVAGCGGAGDTSAFGFASLRVINLQTGGGNADFTYADQEFATALPYANAVPEPGQSAQLIESGDATITATTFGASGTTVSKTITAEPNVTYTAVLTGASNGTGANALQVVVTGDNLASLNSSQSHFRVINNAPVADAVDVYLTTEDGTITSATPVITNLTHTGTPLLLHFNSGPTRIWVTKKGSKTPLHNAVYNFEGGEYGTMTIVNDGANTGTVFWIHSAPLATN